MLIGREKEQGWLREAYQSDESQFVAVYGRRRVGNPEPYLKVIKVRLLGNPVGC